MLPLVGLFGTSTEKVACCSLSIGVDATEDLDGLLPFFCPLGGFVLVVGFDAEALVAFVAALESDAVPLSELLVDLGVFRAASEVRLGRDELAVSSTLFLVLVPFLAGRAAESSSSTALTLRFWGGMIVLSMGSC